MNPLLESLSAGIAKGFPSLIATPTDPEKPIPSKKFSDFASSKDTKVMSKVLGQLGLIGSDQMFLDNPNQNDPNSIRHSQGDWKVAAIQKILGRAYDKNLRTPTEILANKKYLLGGLDQPYQDAINSQTFNNIHPNFWQVISEKLIPMQWAKMDAKPNTGIANGMAIKQ